jgi:hypothetical protein
MNQPLIGHYNGDAANAATSGAATLTVKSAFDIDDNGATDAGTDGLMIIRHLFGLSGPVVSSGALGPEALRVEPAQIAAYLTAVGPLLDVDGDGNANALTDGQLILRLLFGLRGAALVEGAVGIDAVRQSAGAIESHISGLVK